MAAAANAAATAEAVDAEVQKEQEQVRQILASAAALQAETSQSEWSEEDEDEEEDISDEEEDEGEEDGCKGPLLGGREAGGSSSRKPGLGRNRFRRHKYNFAGLASDVESTGYTTDGDGGLENMSVFNDAGLTDAEGIICLMKYIIRKSYTFNSSIGALSDINSLLNDGIPVGDFDMADDTSLSSRASSRFFDSEPILSLESFANSAGNGQLVPG